MDIPHLEVRADGNDMTSSGSGLDEQWRPAMQGRIQTIDLVKGVDIVLMVLFNYSVTLSYFRLMDIPSGFFYQTVFPIAIASVFIFLSGIAAHISYERRREYFSNRYFVRGARLLLFAGFITLVTSIFTPALTIYFGILHFFAVSSFLVPIFIRYRKLSLIASMVIMAAGASLQHITFSFSHLLWLGFIPETFSTFDYFPLAPWLGVLLLGISSADHVIDITADLRFTGRLAAAVTVLGKNSLLIYLLHQPVLIVLLMASGFKLF